MKSSIKDQDELDVIRIKNVYLTIERENEPAKIKLK